MRELNNQQKEFWEIEVNYVGIIEATKYSNVWAWLCVCDCCLLIYKQQQKSGNISRLSTSQ